MRILIEVPIPETIFGEIRTLLCETGFGLYTIYSTITYIKCCIYIHNEILPMTYLYLSIYTDSLLVR